MKQAIAVIVALAVIAAIIWGGFYIKRWFNWEFAYKDSVQAQIDETVKPMQAEIEALKQRVKSLEGKR